MADLKFDCEAFNNAITQYRSVATAMEDNKRTLIKKMDELKDSWQSDAGVAFSSFYNENWGAHVDQYVAILNQLAKLLEKARDEYAELEKQIPKIYQE